MTDESFKPIPILQPVRLEVGPYKVELRDVRSQAMRVSGIDAAVGAQMLEVYLKDHDLDELEVAPTLEDPHQIAFGVFLNGVMIGSGGFVEVTFDPVPGGITGRLLVSVPNHLEIAEAIVAAADGYEASAEDEESEVAKVMFHLAE
jgi:hypothetical protein